jgi:hypothetical protein
MPPPDGITSGTSREGLTERPPATPGPASPDDDTPAPRVAASQILDRVLIFAAGAFLAGRWAWRRRRRCGLPQAGGRPDSPP